VTNAIVSALEAPGCATRFRAEDIRDVRRFAAGFDGSHSRLTLGSGAFRYECATLEGRALLFGWVEQTLAVATQGRARSNYLQLPLVGEIHHAWGRKRLRIEVGEAAFVVAGQHTRAQTGPGRILGVRIPADLLNRQVERTGFGGVGAWTFRSCKIPAEAKGLESLRILLGEAIRTAGLSAEEAADAAIETAEAGVVAALVDVLVECGGLARISVLTGARAKLLEAWIEEHLNEPITLRALSEVSGVGARSLQKSFVALRGLSPMQYVLQRRLEVSRLRLMNSAPGSDVTGVAMECGFTHMGRFSVTYRQRFGESPSTTLRR
jgi:AraC-like DNA-binding protein